MEALSAIEQIVRDLLVLRCRDERGLRGAAGDHLAHAGRQSAEADHGGAELSGRRDRGGGDDGHSRTPIPGLDTLIDVGAPIALIWYWWTFFRTLSRGGSKAPARASPGTGGSGDPPGCNSSKRTASSSIASTRARKRCRRSSSSTRSELRPARLVRRRLDPEARLPHRPLTTSAATASPSPGRTALRWPTMRATSPRFSTTSASLGPRSSALSIGGVIAQELYSPAPGTRRRARALRHRSEDRNRRILGRAHRRKSSAAASKFDRRLGARALVHRGLSRAPRRRNSPASAPC